MTKKRNWLGTLVLLTAFAVVAVGCDQITDFLGMGDSAEEPIPEDDKEPVSTAGAEAFLRQFVEAWNDCEKNAAIDTGDHWIRPLSYGDKVLGRLYEIAVRTHNRDNGYHADYEYWKMGEPIAAVLKNNLQAVAVADADLPKEGAGLNEFRYGGWYNRPNIVGRNIVYEKAWEPEHIYKAIPDSGCRINTRFEHEGKTYTVSFYLIKADGEIIKEAGEAGKKVNRDWKVYWYDEPVEIIETEPVSTAGAEAFLRQLVEDWTKYAKETFPTHNDLQWMRSLLYGNNMYLRMRMFVVTEAINWAGDYRMFDEIFAAVLKNGLQAVPVADGDLPREGGGLETEYSYGGWTPQWVSLTKQENVWFPKHTYTAIQGSGRRIDLPTFTHDGKSYAVSFYLIQADGEIIKEAGKAGEKVDRGWKLYWVDGL